MSHLIRKGAVIGLVEFHHAEEARLVSPVKQMIDRFAGLDPVDGKRRGGLHKVR